ncbi:MAG: DUF1080 domain-containing protein [Acidobacteria bacterium]|nr:DUF1080 domain-containing protein [Acidobacteriota bacterium]
MNKQIWVVVGLAAFVLLGVSLGQLQRHGRLSLSAVLAEASSPLQPAGQTLAADFDKDKTGGAPPGFHSARTGQGPEGTWVVVTDTTAPSKTNVVAQTSGDRTDYRFPLLIADHGSYKDLDLIVKFKAVDGEVDRAAGLVFRLVDANNYYVVRANALEDNLRLYHVVDGTRRQFAGANFKVTAGEWHELKVDCVGNRITCYYDGQKKIEATDDTFKEAGKIGLWTKADSLTHFDDLRVVAK